MRATAPIWCDTRTLVLEPTETVTSMLEYLELDSSPETGSEVLSRGSERIPTLPGIQL